MTVFEAAQIGALLTQVACEGDDNLTNKIVVTPDGKLDPNASAENLYVWEVFKIMTAAVLASDRPGGVFAAGTAPPPAAVPPASGMAKP